MGGLARGGTTASWSSPMEPIGRPIHVQLTCRPRLCSPEEVRKWRIFWNGFIGLFSCWTCYKLVIPPNNPEAFGPLGNSDPFLVLQSTLTGPFASDVRAAEKTQAACRILLAMGFMDLTMPHMKHILLTWGYPNRKWLRRTMPGLVEGLEITSDDVGIPDLRWLEYIQWGGPPQPPAAANENGQYENGQNGGQYGNGQYDNGQNGGQHGNGQFNGNEQFNGNGQFDGNGGQFNGNGQ
ncbi:hypothetical protein SMACR_03715 [Sordaria macrospora]|uniref:WGS project CABT00000000 data, contig 2.9 n=2 Tax=Sordaria macrospora TaxID=5147 RepID=F7VVZ1_SORMK|nr:uncharacterized protein SMAC_03715 [Sordaria macrospora k-hell]KAA8635070.1 hypothetical protein SMACR_03715 [Sordaria macrospora]KAH7625670.1 hypothetical protein B0T09DRAFT_324903 [Sordaria sp. MPI-SDFR-AT-0083]WPJ66111.1 hypothetical protein SMAC4_03715 [Sordaria macrospora]CCC09682.1 unnamed protein product [Sordaria macrospora k-hell]